MRSNQLRRASDRRGMTLLELILALALAALLLMAISMSLQMHWKAFDVKRTDVERKLLVRSIQRHITDDLRSAIKFEPPDLSGLEAAASAAASAAANAGTGDSGGDMGSGDTNNPDGPMVDDPNPDGPQPRVDDRPEPQPPTPTPLNEKTKTDSPDSSKSKTSDKATSGKSTSSNSTGGKSSGTGATGGSGNTAAQGTGAQTEPATESGPSVVVGLYGTASELQFDISRLPRIDQYQAVADSETSAVQIPSDIKTICYFLRSEESALAEENPLNPVSMQPSTTGTGRGLMRAESDRAVSAWGELNGAGQSQYGGAKLLAEEVTSLQFQYFDGTAWVSEWNSDELGGLPTAIEVLMTIAMPGTSVTSPYAAPAPDQATTDPLEERPFRMVVHLPVGGQKKAETEEPAAEGTDPSGTMGSTGAPAEEGGTMP